MKVYVLTMTFRGVRHAHILDPLPLFVGTLGSSIRKRKRRG